MNQSIIPDYIQEGAKQRIAETIAEQKETFSRIENKDHPMEAEPDVQRKIAYVKRQVGVNSAIAEAIANYQDPQTLPISDEKKSKAESIQGPTVDFMSICFADLCRAASRSVARVVFADGRPQGTGFMISPDLFITNNHVINSAEAARGFLLEFNYELDFRKNLLPLTRYVLDPDTFFLTNPSDGLDFTVVAVGAAATGVMTKEEIGFLPLFDTDDKHIMTMFLNVIQHPGGDTKQLVVRENRLLARTDTTLIYGSDTEPGASGSPVFNDDWEVVALHHWGEPYRSLVDQPQGLPENGNEGIRISAIVQYLHTPGGRQGMSPAQLELLDRALGATFRAPSLIAQASAAKKIPVPLSNESTPKNTPVMATSVKQENNLQVSNGIASFTVPLTISIQLGDAKSLQPAPVAEATEESEAVKTVTATSSRSFAPDPNYKTRKGYSTGFLGVKVDLPKLSAAQVKDAAMNSEARPGDLPYELKYTNFSVVMNGPRRIAFFTAVNIDGASVIKIDRTTGQVTRTAEALGSEGAESGREKWYNDPRISEDEISEDGIYKKSLPHFQRGHLVKRTDPSWGTPTKAYKGQSDTFHFTNCSPQHEGFNPKTTRWAGIENWITNTSDDDNIRVSVFSGPIFADDDPKVDYLRIPKEFWKVIAWTEDGELYATGIIADQGDLIEGVGEAESAEAIFDPNDPQKFPKDYHVTVKEVERRTGLSFGTLKNHDVLNQAGGHESLGGEATDTPGPEPRRITSYNDILPGRKKK